MQNGGYKIIDLKNTNLTSTAKEIAGIYNAIGQNNRKVLLLSGLVINGVELSDVFVKSVKIGNDYVLNAYYVVADNELTAYDILVEDDDKVTLQVKTVKGAETLDPTQEYFTTKEGE